MNKPKVTYLLGAGASFHALPLINNIPQAISNFINYVKQYDKTYNMKMVNSFAETNEICER